MFKNLGTAVRNILILNLLFFGVEYLISDEMLNQIVGWHFLNPNFQPSQIITHMFLHGGILHIALNMLGLWMFGLPIEKQLGTKNFLIFYLVTGISAYFLHCLTISDISVPMVGASGAIYGLLGAFMMLYPNQKVSLIFLPFFGFKAKYFILVLLFIEFILFLTVSDGIGHMAHIGGALSGILMLKLFKNKLLYGTN